MTLQTGPKAFLDTEVFLRGLVLDEPPYGALFDGSATYRLAMSDQVFSEILDCVRRSASLRAAVPAVAGISLPDIFNGFDVEIVRIPSSMSLAICRDPGDNKFLASAMYLECDYLVTEVADLLALETNAKWNDFRKANGVTCTVVTPARFLELARG